MTVGSSLIKTGEPSHHHPKSPSESFVECCEEGGIIVARSSQMNGSALDVSTKVSMRMKLGRSGLYRSSWKTRARTLYSVRVLRKRGKRLVRESVESEAHVRLPTG